MGNAYQEAMNEYYTGLVNAWDKNAEKAYYEAIKALSSDLHKADKSIDFKVQSMLDIINDRLGDQFSVDASESAKNVTEIAYRQGLLEGKSEVKIGMRFDYSDRRKVDIIGRQNIFWLSDHHNAKVSNQFKKVLTSSFESGLTKADLQKQLKNTFQDIVKKGDPYFKGLAEHTSLKVRQIGRIEAYSRAQIEEYIIRAIVDKRTSDICLALDGKRFKVARAVQMIEELMSIDIKGISPEKAKEQLKKIAPFANQNSVQYKNGVPSDVKGDYVLFPPFHWLCRSITEAVL